MAVTWTILFNSFYRDAVIFVCLFRDTTENLFRVKIGSQGPKYLCNGYFLGNNNCTTKKPQDLPNWARAMGTKELSF